MNTNEFKILLVEDDDALRFIVKDNLEQKNYDVKVAEDGKIAIELFAENDFDLILLDVMLPKIDGFEVAKTIRKTNEQVPIIFLTARSMTEDKIKGLTLGGDDYIPKPFSFEELLARIRAVLRRHSSAGSNVLNFADLTLDLISHKVIRGGKEIELTAKEYSLMEYLMRNPNRVLTRTMITQHVWDYNFDSFTNVIDVYVNYLRNKVDRGFPQKLIHTVRGVGYILKEGDKK